jgi:hypothetical protein
MRNTKVSIAPLIYGIAAYVAICVSGCSSPTNDKVAATNADSTPTTQRGSEIIAEYLKRDSALFRKSRVRLTTSEEGKPNEVYEIDNRPMVRQRL